MRENSSLQHFGQVWFCIRAATFLLLVKEEGKESEAALTAGSPLSWLMFAWEQGESLTAPDEFYCLKVTEQWCTERPQKCSKTSLLVLGRPEHLVQERQSSVQTSKAASRFAHL